MKLNELPESIKLNILTIKNTLDIYDLSDNPFRCNDYRMEELEKYEVEEIRDEPIRTT